MRPASERALAREEFVDVGGARLWCDTSGSGDPLVLLHGGPGAADNLGPVAQLVDDLVTVHRFDQRACGRSSGCGIGQTVDTVVADLEALRRHWGHSRWIVGGHSGGAALALLYATRYPERVRAVVSMSGPGVGPPITAPAARGFAERLTEEERDALLLADRRAAAGDLPARRAADRLRWKSLFADPANATAHAASLSPFPHNAEVFRVLRASIDPVLCSPEHVAAIRDVDVPVLVLHGREDPLPLEGSLNVAELLGRSTVAIIEAAGHLPWFESPRATRHALRAFLTEILSPIPVPPTTRSGLRADPE